MRSFKNIVILKNENCIKKIFKNELDFYTELFFYENFQDFNLIPRLISIEKPEISLQYLSGKNLYNSGTNEQLCLARTLALFHNLTINSDNNLCLIHFDTNLNNYIFSCGSVFMIDFSDISIGSPLSDLYSILLFFCEVHTGTDFKDFLRDFVQIYVEYFNGSLFHSELLFEKEVNRFEIRRKTQKKSIHNYNNYLENRKNLRNYIIYCS